MPLAAALGLPAGGAARCCSRVDRRPARLAFAVETVEGEEEVLVRPLPRRAPVAGGVDGAALLASGEPVGVLAPQALLARASGARRAPPRGPPARAAAARRACSWSTTRWSRARWSAASSRTPASRSRSAGDGDEALRRLAAEPFDALVTDIEMPGIDGFELTAQLRGIERFARLPIVVVSTRDRPEDRLRGLRAGADAYLTKQSLGPPSWWTLCAG